MDRLLSNQYVCGRRNVTIIVIKIFNQLLSKCSYGFVDI